jgi:hypothetical protein
LDLGARGGKGALAALILATYDADPSVVRSAATGLGMLEPPAMESISRLEELTERATPEIATAASTALHQVRR